MYILLKISDQITLCNITYKTITKVFINMLRMVTNTLVSPCESSFIPWRQSRDNIIVAQEFSHVVKRRRSGKGSMVIKKTWRKPMIGWSGVSFKTLWLLSIFLDNLLLWLCIVSLLLVRMHWNEEVLEEFKSSRGIRKGCHLSTYIFVLLSIKE